MSVSLDDFIKEAQQTLAAFETDWRKNHQKHPDIFPLKLPNDNCGIWWEMLMEFDEFESKKTKYE